MVECWVLGCEWNILILCKGNPGESFGMEFDPSKFELFQNCFPNHSEGPFESSLMQIG